MVKVSKHSGIVGSSVYIKWRIAANLSETTPHNEFLTFYVHRFICHSTYGGSCCNIKKKKIIKKKLKKIQYNFLSF